jgi:stringent starvation protein B
MGSAPQAMTSNRPYLLRALYEWITDNSLTPHVLIDAGYAGVDVPDHAISQGKVVLNIASSATEHLQLENQTICFMARFSGQPYKITVPMAAVIAIYARENGQGMMFAQDDTPPPPVDGPEGTPARAHLKVVK